MSLLEEIDGAVTPVEIHEAFENYKAHLKKIRSFDDALFVYRDEKEWIAGYVERSMVIREAYRENNLADEKIGPYLRGQRELTDSIANALYKEILPLTSENFDDAFYGVKAVETLIDFFNENNDTEKVLFLYNRLGFDLVSTIRSGYRENGKKALDAYMEILSFRDKYSTFKNPKIRRLFFVAYYNIICCLPELNVISFSKSYELLREMEEFWESNTVQKLDAGNEEIKSLVQWTYEKWLSYEDKIASASVETQEYFCRLARKYYEKQLVEAGGNVYRISVEALLGNYRALILENRCSYSEALEYLLAYYDIRKLERNHPLDTKEFGIDADFFFETMLPNALIFRWLKDSRVSKEMREKETKRLIMAKSKYLQKISRKDFSVYMNETLSNWSFDSLNYLDNFEEKERAIFNNILNRQLSTFFHSHMVSELSEHIVAAVLKKEPLFFKDMGFGNDAESILKNRDRLEKFIKKAALFHDIGKIRMTDIINLQYRRLTDEEFKVIKRHPGIGADSVDEDFDAYHDIILGHHKWYNGKEGYPEKYDSNASRVKGIIDIITIADTLDAATDYYGRNYAKKKTFQEVLKELEGGRGSRYNGFILDLIRNDGELYESLNLLLTKTREHEYYRLMCEHLFKKKSMVN